MTYLRPPDIRAEPTLARSPSFADVRAPAGAIRQIRGTRDDGSARLQSVMRQVTSEQMTASTDRSGSDDEALFELRFAPSVALVSIVRRFVSEFYDELLGDADASHRLAMATHEMLENAVHYSSDRKSELVVSLHRKHREFVVTIRTKNRASGERLVKVRHALDEVVNANDPAALYNQLVRRAAKRTDGGSGLGLGRIRAEGDLALSYEIEGDTVVVTAEGRFQSRSSSSPNLPADAE